MPVILLKWKPERIPELVMRKLISQLPAIVSSALDVPEDESKRLTPGDIQIWSMPADRFDVNTQDLQMMIPVHGYQERVVNLEERKNTITKQIGDVLAGCDLLSPVKISGWVWILPSSDTAFGKISFESDSGKVLLKLPAESCICDAHGNVAVIDWDVILKLDFPPDERRFLERLRDNKNFFTDPCTDGQTNMYSGDMARHINSRFDCVGLKYRLRKRGGCGEYRIAIRP